MDGSWHLGTFPGNCFLKLLAFKWIENIPLRQHLFQTNKYKCHLGKIVQYYLIWKQLFWSAADPRFPQRGRQLPGGGGGANIWFCQIFQKNAWNQKNLGAQEGGGASLP